MRVKLNLQIVPGVFLAKWQGYTAHTFEALEIKGHPHLMAVQITETLIERIPRNWLIILSK